MGLREQRCLLEPNPDHGAHSRGNTVEGDLDESRVCNVGLDLGGGRGQVALMRELSGRCVFVPQGTTSGQT